MALDGTLRGASSARDRGRPIRRPCRWRSAAGLAITFQAQEALSPYAFVSPTPPQITFASGLELPGAKAFAVAEDGTPAALRTERKVQVFLSPELLAEDGFATLTLDT
ncbi:MAG: hypothetical protein WDN28_21915 [Chthoniobacter sp.]